MTDAVAERVLRGNYTQTQALSLARAQAPRDARRARPLHARPRGGGAARPRARGAARRRGDRRAARGRPRPHAARAGGAARLREDHALRRAAGVRPARGPGARRRARRATSRPPLPERFGDAMRRHRLRREIVATRVTNDLVDRAGTTFVYRLREDTGASPADIARASLVARDVFGVRALWEEVEALDGVVAADVQTEMLLSARRSVERATRWLLRSRPRPLDIAAETARYAEGARIVAGALPGILVESEQEAWRERVGRLTEAGVPEALAGARRHPERPVQRARHRRGRGRDRAAGRGRRGAALPARRQPRAALAARPDRRAPAHQPLAGDGARRAARRPLLAARGADHRRAALRRHRRLDGGQPPRRRARAGDPRRDPLGRHLRSHHACPSRCARCAT